MQENGLDLRAIDPRNGGGCQKGAALFQAEDILRGAMADQKHDQGDYQ